MWACKLSKLADKPFDLRAWAVPGNDFRAQGVTWERKLNNSTNTSIDLRAWSDGGVTWERKFDKLGATVDKLGDECNDLIAWGVTDTSGDKFKI